MPKLHVVSQHVDVQQLPDVFLLVVVCGQFGAASSTSLVNLVRSLSLLHSRGCTQPRAFPHKRGRSPDRLELDANFLRILPSSLSTRVRSASLLEHPRMSATKVCVCVEHDGRV